MSEPEKIEKRYAEIDGAIYDTVTGELVDGIPMDTAFDDMAIITDIESKHLPLIARILISNERQQDHLNNPRPVSECRCPDCELGREYNRISEIYNNRFKSQVLCETNNMDRAAVLLERAGERKIQMPGLGTFRFNKGSKHVDANVYDDMTDSSKSVIETDNPELFTVKSIISPKRADIKKAIDSGKVIEGFEIVTNPDKFVFKKE